MSVISIGRGCDSRYGDVSDLDPTSWNSKQMKAVSLGRGQNPSWGNIDYLLKKKKRVPGERMLILSAMAADKVSLINA